MRDGIFLAALDAGTRSGRMPPVRARNESDPRPTILRFRIRRGAETPRARLRLLGGHALRRQFRSRDVTGRFREARELLVRHLRAIHPEWIHFRIVQRLLIRRAIIRAHREGTAGHADHVAACAALVHARVAVARDPHPLGNEPHEDHRERSHDDARKNQPRPPRCPHCLRRLAHGMSFTQRKPVFWRPVSVEVFMRALGR